MKKWDCPAKIGTVGRSVAQCSVEGLHWQGICSGHATIRARRDLPIHDGLQARHPRRGQVTVLEEDPASLEYLSLRDELLRPGSLAAPQRDDVQVESAPS